MKRIIYFTIIQLLITGFSHSPLLAQDNLQMYFEGIMKSGGEEPVPYSLDEMDVELSMHDLDLMNTLWESKFLARTDSLGFFGFEIINIDQYFEKTENGTILLEVGLLPTANSRWETSGNNFSMSYSIHKIVRNDSILFEITRLVDSQKLPFLEDNGILLLYDEYPFSFLQGGFIISLNRRDDSLASLKKILTGEISRGVKGGFAVGGYRHKK